MNSNQEYPLICRVKCLDNKLFILLPGGNSYDLPKSNGRGNNITIEELNEQLRFENFYFDGNPYESMTIRKSDDKELALEVNHRKYEAGNDLSLWYCNGHFEWACRFRLNPDMTISPVDNESLVLGVSSCFFKKIIFVKNSDDERKMIFDKFN